MRTLSYIYKISSIREILVKRFHQMQGTFPLFFQTKKKNILAKS